MVRSVGHKATYFYVVMLLAPLATLAHAWAPNVPWVMGQDPGIVIGLSMLGVVAILWTIYRPSVAWTSIGGSILALAGTLWFWEFYRIVGDNAGYNYLVVATPLVLVLVAVKRPISSDGPSYFALLGAAIVAVAAVAFLLGKLNVMPDGFVGPEGGIATRYPWLGAILGADTRWIGPFGSVNYTAAAGGLALVCGLAAGIRWRVPIVVGGVLILLLSQGDAATFAACMGALVFALWSGRASSISWLRHVRLPATVLVLLVAGAAAAMRDGALDVRLRVWRNFFGLWMESPFLGAGTPGVYAFINANTGDPAFVPYTHAHSVLLNGLALYGIPWFVLMLSILGVTLYLAWRAIAAAGSGPMAIVVYVVLGGLAETTYAWTSWGLYSAALLAALAAVAPGRPSRRLHPSRDYAELMTQGDT